MIHTDQHQRSSAHTVQFPSGQEVYDRIMREIEPELVTDNLKHLDEPYTHETPEEHNERYARYSRAFAQYKVDYQKWATQMKAAIHAYKRAVTRAAEGAEREEEEMILQHLEDEIQTL